MSITNACKGLATVILFLLVVLAGCGKGESTPEEVTFVKPEEAGAPPPAAGKVPLGDVDVDQLDGNTMAAKVGDYEIPLGLLRKNIATMEETFKAQYQEKGNLGVLMVYQYDFVGQALANLVDNRVMLILAKKRGYEVTEQELNEHIQRFTAFQTDGKFDQAKYDRLLLENNFSREAFEDAQREQLLVRRVADAAYREAQVTDDELRKEYEVRESKINLRFLRLSRQLIDQQVEVGDAEAKKYFAANRDKFTYPEARRVDAVIFQAREYLDGVSITDAEVKDYFDKNRDKFAVREQVHAQHILKKIPADGSKTEEQVLAEIKQLRAEIEGGAAFADVAREHSDCPSASRGGDLGLQPRGVWAKPFEDAAFALQPGKLSEPIKTPFGYHLIKVLEKRTAEETSLEKSAEKIKLMIKTEKALEIAKQEAAAFRDGMSAAPTLSDYAKGKGRQVKTSELIYERRPMTFAGEKISDFRAALELSRQVFEMNLKDVSRPFAAGSGVYIVQLLEIVPPRPMNYEDSGVHERSLAGAKNEVLKQRLADKANAILGEIRGGKSLDAVAKKYQLTVEETGLFARKTAGGGEAAKQSGQVPKIGRAPELLEKVFALTPQKPLLPELYPVGMDLGIFMLKESIPADMQKFEEQKEKFRLQLQGEKAQQILRGQLDEAKQTIKIEIDQSLIEKLKQRQNERREQAVAEMKKNQPAPKQ